MKLGVRAIGVAFLAACALVGFSAAFALAADADSGPAQTTTTTTTTTTEPPPTTPPVPPPSEPAPPPRQVGIPGGVTIAAVDVGGLLPYQAASLVRKSFARPLVLAVSPTRKVRLSPEALGAKPAVDKAVSRARFSRPGAAVPLHVWVSRDRIRGYVESLGREVDRAPVSAQLVLRGARVRATRSVDGRRLERVAGSRAIRVALKTNARSPIPLSFAVLKPKVAEDTLGPAVVILRGSNTLRYYRRREARAHVRSRHRAVCVPDAHRQLRDRDDAAKSVVVSAPLRLGRRLRPCPSRARKSLGHALDGDLGAVRRHPRHAGLRLDRLLRLARVHSHANP